MKTRLTTLLASALLAAGTFIALPAAAQIVATPNLGAPIGAPIVQTPFFQGVPTNATIPSIVPGLSSPRPLQNDVNPNITQIRITFDQPMDTALFFWPIPTNDANWPVVTATPFWENGNRTVVLPVKLAAGRIYAIPINSPNLVFRGATGLYVNPGLYRFETRGGSQGGSVSLGRQPSGIQTPVPMPAPLQGGSQNQGMGAAAPNTIGATPASNQGGKVLNRSMQNRQQGGAGQPMSNPALANPGATPLGSRTR